MNSQEEEQANSPKPKIFTKFNTILAILAALYTASPVDVIPDVLFPVGLIDDIGIIGAVIVVIATHYFKQHKKDQ